MTVSFRGALPVRPALFSARPQLSRPSAILFGSTANTEEQPTPVIVLNGPINASSAKAFIGQLSDLTARPDVKSVRIKLNSGGGSLLELFTMIDALSNAKDAGITVETECQASVAGAAAVLFALGSPGHRYMAENASFGLLEPVSSASGSHSDVRKSARVLSALRQSLVDLLADASGGKETAEGISEAMRQDTWYTAQAAQESGFVDHVIPDEPAVSAIQ